MSWSSGAARRSAVRQVCSIAWRTARRGGAAAALLALLGLTALFFTVSQMRAVLLERHTPYVLTATAGRTADLGEIRRIDGVTAVTPLLQLEGTLELDGYTRRCSLSAVYAAFPDLTLTEGTRFTDGANMPQLLLNQAAASGFEKDRGTKRISAGDTVTLQVGEDTRTAQICGIFDDGSRTSVGYMSYDTAARFYGQGDRLTLRIALSGKNKVESVAAALKKLSVTPELDPTLGPAWQYAVGQCRQSGIVSLCLLLCSVLLLRERRRRELPQNEAPREMLLLSGLTMAQIRAIYPLRLAFFYLAAFLASAAAAALLRAATLPGTLLGLLLALGLTALAALPSRPER